MKLFSGSGGSTKGRGIVGVYKGLYDNGYRPDIITGISISAILSVPMAMGKFKEIDAIFNSPTLHNDMWKYAPVKKNGKFSLNAIYVWLRDKIAIGDISDTRKLLSKVITEKDFKLYKEGNYPICLVYAVDFVNGKGHLINLKEVSYKEYLDWCMASAAIPIFNMPICIDNKILYDGGVRSHIATAETIEQYDITSSISVFTRPKDYQLKDLSWKPKNPIDVLLRTEDIRTIEISKKDELDIDKILRKKRLKKKDNQIVYLPSILESLYDTNTVNLNKLYKIGYILGNSLKY